MHDDTIRPIDLLAPPALDERAVQEYARAMRTAVALATEHLGATTRRESQVGLADILEPVGREAVDDLLGVMLALRHPESEATVGVLHLSDHDAVSLADLFLGGPGQGADRPIVPIEAKVIAHALGPIIAPIVGTATFTEMTDLRIAPTGDAGALPPYLVAADLTIEVGQMSIAGQLFVPDPDRTSPVGSGTATPVVSASAAEMPIELEIDLAVVDMTAAEVQTLGAGDVVIFDSAIDAPASARHAGRRLCDGTISEKDGHRLFEVTRVHSA